MSTIPTPDYTKTPDTDRNPFSDKRTYEYRWVAPRELGADGDNAVQLTISHYKQGRSYDVDIRPVRVDGLSVRITFAFRDQTPVTVKRVPAARYSRKVLDALAAEALAEFPASIPAGGGAAALWALIEQQPAQQ